VSGFPFVGAPLDVSGQYQHGERDSPAATVRSTIMAQSPNEFRPSGQGLPEPSR